MFTKYVIVCQARTGSTMLSSALENHIEVCGHGEVLNLRNDKVLEFYGLNYNQPGPIVNLLRTKLALSPADYLHEYVFYAGDLKAVGFKFKYEELSNPLFFGARTYLQRCKDIKIIHMIRENLWERFLSEHIAINITKRFNSRDEPIRLSELKFSLNKEKVKSSFDQTEEWQKRYFSLFSNHDSIKVCYEKFLEDPNSEFSRVTDFLNVSSVNFEPLTKRISKEQSQNEMVTNLSEIKNFFSDTKYSKFFN